MKMKKAENIIDFFNRFFYNDKSKLGFIIQHIFEFKDKKNIKISQERKIYLNNFYLNNSLEFILNNNYVTEFKLEEKLMEAKDFDIEESIFREEILEDKELFVDTTLKKIIDNFKQEINKMEKRIYELVLVTNYGLNLKNINEKLKEIFDLKDFKKNSDLFNKNEFNILEGIVNLEIVSYDIEVLKDIIDSCLHKEWDIIKVNLENRNRKIKEIEDRVDGNKENNYFDLFNLYLEPILETKWDVIFKGQKEARETLSSALLLIGEYREINPMNKEKKITIEDILDEDLKKYYDFIEETYTDFYEKEIFKNMFDKNKNMEISDYKFFIDILMDDILDLEDILKKEKKLIKVKNLEDEEVLKEIFGEDIVNEEKLINMKALKNKYFKENRNRYYYERSKDSLKMDVERKKNMFMRKYIHSEEKIKEIEKLKFKIYVDIFNGLQSLKYDSDNKEQPSDEMKKLYAEICEEIDKNKKLKKLSEVK